MDFKDVVKQRRMVRNFKPEPVPMQAVENILDLARRAPSAGFTQGQSFIVVTKPDLKKAVAAACQEEEYVEAGFDPFISGAPVLVVPCTSEAAYHGRYQESDKLNPDETEIDWPVPYWFMDIGCAVMTILLAVVNAGLAAGFAGATDLEALRNALSIPPQVTPVGVIPIGHPAPDKRSPSLQRGRKPKTEVIHKEGW
jgi:nitroreductase